MTTLDKVLKYPMASETYSSDDYIKTRGISKSTLDYFRVRVEWNGIDDCSNSYYLPVTKSGKLSGFVKYDRHLPKNNGRFQMIGDVSVDCDLLGQHRATDGKKLFIVEGFFDLFSAFQALDDNKPDGFKGTPSVVSPALGIGDPSKGITNSRQHIANNIEFVNNYKEKIICFDNDSSKEVNAGQEGVQDLAVVLRDFKNVVLPVNDCNEMLVRGSSKDLYWAFMNATKFESENVLQGGLPLEDLLIPLKKGVYVDCLPKTMKLLRGFREKEMTIVLAGAGAGKTTICKEISYSLLKAGESVGHIFLEEDIAKSQQSFLALDNNVPLPMFREDPAIVSLKDVNNTYDTLLNTDRTMWMEHFGSLTAKTLMTKFEWMAIRGMKYIVLDHISMVFSGTESNNERKDIDLLLTELAAFTVKTGVHPIIVSHIKRVNKRPPRDKEGNIQYPYWDEIDMTQARGSGAFEQLGWNVVIIEQQILEDRSRGYIRTNIAKNREWGAIGPADILQQIPATGRMKVVKPSTIAVTGEEL